MSQVAAETAIFTALDEIRMGPDHGAAYLKGLYDFLLTGSNTFADQWSKTGADSKIIIEIFEALATHILQWNAANEETGIKWELKADGNGWLGLEPELEQAEFDALEDLWRLSQDAALDTAAFFQEAEKISGKSKLFSLLRSMEVTRPNGTTKMVWPHVKSVVLQSQPETLKDFGILPAAFRQSRFKFAALGHDLVNVVAINNDWLQLHAHGAAALIYRFLVVRLRMESEEATSIVRMIDLHHILQLQKLKTVEGSDRVLEPEEMAASFARREQGLEELSRLIWFSLVDVGTLRQDFRSEHIAASLELIQQFIELDNAHDLTEKITLAQAAIEQAAQTIDYLQRQMEREDERTPLFEQLSHEIRNAISVLKTYLQLIANYMPHAALAMTDTEV